MPFETQMSFFKQLAVLTNRSVVVAKREPLAYLVRLVANFCATFFFGIIYIETRDKVQEQVISRTFFLMFCMGIPMQFILVSNFIYHFQVRRYSHDALIYIFCCNSILGLLHPN